MKYENLKLIDFCYYLYDYEDLETDVLESEMYNYLKYITGNFDKTCFGYIISDLRTLGQKLEFYIQNPKFQEGNFAPKFLDEFIKVSAESVNLYINDVQFTFDSNLTFREKINLINESEFFVNFEFGIDRLLKFSDIAEFEYKKVNDTTSPLPTFTGKRPVNTHNQQFALLERLGVIDYLKKEYNLPDTKMSELIANILNRDIQNTRIMLSNTGNKECESKKLKNKDVIDPILIKTGANKVD